MKSANFGPVKSDLFSDSRVRSYKKSGHIKCAASQGLSVLPVIAVWVELVVKPAGLCADAARAVVSLCDLVEALQCSLFGIVTVDQVRSCVYTFLQASLNAGFRDSVIPKFHWAVHFATHLERFGKCLTCWTHERKHRWVKRYASDIANTTSYSTSVLTEVVSHQLYDMSQDGAFDATVGLVEPTKAPPQLAEFIRLGFNNPHCDVYTSAHARVPPITPITNRDVLLVRSGDGDKFRAGQAWLLTSVTGYGDFALCSMWALETPAEAHGFAVWRKQEVPELIALPSVLTAVCWCESSAGCIRTLIPYQFRGLRASS